MNAHSSIPGGMMARAVLEALASVTTVDRATDALHAALEREGLHEVPDRASAAADFVFGPLHLVVSRIFGEDTADAVTESLRPVVEVASGYHGVPDGSEGPPSGAEAIAGSAAPAPVALPLDPPGAARASAAGLELDLDAPAAPTGTPVVLVATLDRPGVRAVEASLGERAEVRVVADGFEWLAGLDAFTGRRIVVVLDCCLPAFDPIWAAQMASSMPPHTDVVVWGASGDVRDAVLRLVDGVATWHEVGADADAHRLARVVASTL